MYHSLLLPDLLDPSINPSRGGGESSLNGGRGEGEGTELKRRRIWPQCLAPSWTM